jgi:hypothetical protein
MSSTASILLIVESDPRTSHRPAEAIRIAAGIAAWKNVAVHLCLRGPAPFLLSGDPEEIIDGDSLHEYLPVLRRTHVPVWIETPPDIKPKITSPVLPCQMISRRNLALIATQTASVFNF